MVGDVSVGSSIFRTDAAPLLSESVAKTMNTSSRNPGIRGGMRCGLVPTFVCVCVCVRERERERECVCVCTCVQ